MFAQMLFVSHKSVRLTSPDVGFCNPMDSLCWGTRNSTTMFSNVQKSKRNPQRMWFKAVSIAFNDEEWRNCDIKILISTDDSIIKIFANKTHTIHIRNVKEEGNFEDAYIKTFDCIDENGEKCLLDIAMLDDAVMLNIEYEDFSVRYGLIPDYN